MNQYPKNQALAHMQMSHWGKATSVRTQTHRLIFNGKPDAPGSVELYDLESGPDPLRNLATVQPALVEDILEMYRALDKR